MQAKTLTKYRIFVAGLFLRCGNRDAYTVLSGNTVAACDFELIGSKL